MSLLAPDPRVPAVVYCNPDSDGDDCSPAETEACGPAYCGPDGAVQRPTGFLWLELGTKCQLRCVHCYNDSGADGDFGILTVDDWKSVIDQAARHGVELIQLIGGEPTLYPGLADLVHHALDHGLQVEIYSNLVHVPFALWDVFQLPGVRLATSWYSADRIQHWQITGRDTWRHTRTNIAEAVRRGVPIRVGLVTGIIDGQDETAARRALADLGVTRIRADRMRGLGRASTEPDAATELCGNCGNGRAAVLSDGTVTGCPMARWVSAGNITRSSLGDLLAKPLADAVAVAGIVRNGDCDPQTCMPNGDGQCEPACTPGCDPGGVECGPND